MAQNISLRALLESHDTSCDQSHDKDTVTAGSYNEQEEMEVLERKLTFEQYH